MIRQLEHIEVVTRKPTARVGIIPFGAPRAVFPVSSWTLYDERSFIPTGRRLGCRGRVHRRCISLTDDKCLRWHHFPTRYEEISHGTTPAAG